MQLSVTFRHMEPSDALKDYARDKISRVEKYLDSALEAHVVLSVEKFRHIADVTILSDGLKINGQEQTEDMYSAIDMVVDKLERQLKRLKQKIKGHKNKNRVKDKNVRIDVVSEEAEDGPQVIRAHQVFAKPMDVDEAVLQLDLSSEKFLVFTNAETEEINVLHYRDDGNYGLIEPTSE
ncbi:MAG: ribosome-associated translation inhibitor RaiA [Thermodesulfobacteriota bacterium]|nr:ribosome-associated translation inhibitor RaiA [Thermodesulfobacteriota bacterium]